MATILDNLPPARGKSIFFFHAASETIAGGATSADNHMVNVGGYGGLKRFSMIVDFQSDLGTTAHVYWRTAWALDSSGVPIGSDVAPGFWASITVPASDDTMSPWYHTDHTGTVSASEGTTFTALGLVDAPYVGIGFSNSGANPMEAQLTMFMGDLH